MNLNERERELIASSLYILEEQCITGNVRRRTEVELSGVPDPDEVRRLMRKVEAGSENELCPHCEEKTVVHISDADAGDHYVCTDCGETWGLEEFPEEKHRN